MRLRNFEKLSYIAKNEENPCSTCLKLIFRLIPGTRYCLYIYFDLKVDKFLIHKYLKKYFFSRFFKAVDDVLSQKQGKKNIFLKKKSS